MHELSITQQVVDQIVGKLGDVRVRRVRLEVGKLSGIVPDAMAFCFELVTAGTGLEGAALEFDEPHGDAVCRACGHAFVTAEVVPLCEDCGGADVGVTGGAGLRIREVEVESGCVPPADAQEPTTA